MRCWSCGREIPLATGQKIQNRDTCPGCDADLRVCRNCRHYDPAVHNECREVMAEWVRAKDRANYCDYFAPAASSAPPGGQAGAGADAARRGFDNLFKN